jgi:polysaccharide transporter, PST family
MRSVVAKSTRRRVTANMTWLLADGIVRLAVVFVVGVFVARYLGPARFGDLSFATAIVSIFIAISSIGLDPLLVRELVRRIDSHASLMGTVFWLRLVAGAVGSLAAIGVAYVLVPEDLHLVALTVISSAAIVARAFGVIELWFQHAILSSRAVAARLASLAVASTVRIVLVVLEADLVWFAVAISVEALLTAFGLVVVYAISRGPSFVHAFRMNEAKRLLAEGWPGIGASLSVILYMRVDQVMLGMLSSAGELGNYAVSVKLIEAASFLPVLVLASIMPVLVASQRDSVATYSRQLGRLYIAMLYGSATIALVLSTLGPALILFAFGDAYATASAVIRVYAWSFVFVSMSTTTGKWLYIEGLVPYTFTIQGLGAALNMGLNLVLIPRYGGYGAAVATLVSYGASAFVFLWLFKPLRPAARLWVVSLLFPLITVVRRLERWR